MRTHLSALLQCFCFRVSSVCPASVRLGPAGGGKAVVKDSLSHLFDYAIRRLISHAPQVPEQRIQLRARFERQLFISPARCIQPIRIDQATE
jgi:hypothetical protein